MSVASSNEADIARLRSQRALAQNLLLERELVSIARRFAEEQIPLVVLKGVPLTRRLYGGLEAKFSVDNDLLVHLADVPRAAALMHRLGYQGLRGQRLEDDLQSTFQHPMLRQGEGGSTLRAELHWHAFPLHLFDVPEGELWRHTIPFELGGQALLVFDELMTLLHLASHHIQHRCADRKVLRDVGVAWQRFHARLEPAELASMTRRHGLAAALSYSIAAAQQAGFCDGAPPLSSSRAKLLAGFIPSADADPEPSYRALLGSVLLATPWLIPSALLHELFPPLPVLARIYGQQPSRWLYARHPARLARPLLALLSRRGRAEHAASRRRRS